MKRWFVRIFVFLLLGAIVNVAVAVAGARWCDRTVSVMNVREQWVLWDDLGLSDADAAWMEQLKSDEARVEPWPGWSAMDNGQYRLETSVYERSGFALRRRVFWIDHVWIPPDGTPGPRSSWSTAGPHAAMTFAGWPMESLYGEQIKANFDPSAPRLMSRFALGVSNSDATVLATSGVTPSANWAVLSPVPEVRILPLLPIWPGFAINTVFYGLILWLLFAGSFVVRRWRRIRRGLCPKCAYDLHGSVSAKECPECGDSIR